MKRQRPVFPGEKRDPERFTELGYFSMSLYELAREATDGNVPDWFPEPTQFKEMWEEAIREVNDLV